MNVRIPEKKKNCDVHPINFNTIKCLPLWCPDLFVLKSILRNPNAMQMYNKRNIVVGLLRYQAKICAPFSSTRVPIGS